MAGLTDLLGGLLQSGMASRAPERMGNVLGAGESGSSMGDIIGKLGQMMGGGEGAAQGATGGLGDILSGLAGNKAVAGGLGALAGAMLGGSENATRGAIGGGALAMLASVAFSALKNAGQTPSQMPSALRDASPQQQAAVEADSMIIVKAMINAAKADGQIDQQEFQKIVGKISADGLGAEGVQVLLAETNKPMDTQELVTAAQGRPDLAAQIYAASLLAIVVDTPQETAYLRDLAGRLGLSPQVTGHIEQTLGV